MADSYIRRGQYQNNSGVFYQILRNLLLGEDHPLHNRTLHISGTFKMTEKADIEYAKPDIEKMFQPKTASHICKLREAFPGLAIFGRADVMEVIDIKPSRASELLKEMTERRVIEQVSGHAKGSTDSGNERIASE